VDLVEGLQEGQDTDKDARSEHSPLGRLRRWREHVRSRRTTRHVYQAVIGLLGGSIVLGGLLLVPLPGPGLIAGVDTLEENPDAIQAFIAATLRAMEEISDNPEVGLEAAITAVPELGNDQETQRAILEATIDTWRGPLQAERGLGAVDRDGWQTSIAFLEDLGLVPNPITIEDVLRDDLLPAGD